MTKTIDAEQDLDSLPADAPGNPDPVADLINALCADKADSAVCKKARGGFSAIAGAGRPWEQLPTGLKTAARFDAKRLAVSRGDILNLTDAGYSAYAATRLLRDIGRT